MKTKNIVFLDLSPSFLSHLSFKRAVEDILKLKEPEVYGFAEKCRKLFKNDLIELSEIEYFNPKIHEIFGETSNLSSIVKILLETSVSYLHNANVVVKIQIVTDGWLY